MSAASGIRAGVAGAALAVSFAPVDIGYGLIVFQLLGNGFDGLGVASGWLAVLLGTLVVALIMRSAHLYTSVRPAQTLSIAALLALVLNRFPQPDASATAVLALATVMVVSCLSGLFQLAMGAAKVGRLVSFVPRPVLSGVSTAAAIGLAMKAGKTLLMLFVVSSFAPAGADAHVSVVDAFVQGLTHGATSGGSAASAAVPLQVCSWFLFVFSSLALMTWAARHLVFLNWSLVGLLYGVLLYGLLDAVWPASAGGPALGSALPQLSITSQIPVFGQAWHFLLSGNLLPVLIELSVPTAMVVAVVNSLEALVYNARFERSTEVAHDPVKLLVALGAGNTLAGALGGLPVSLSNTKMTLAWNSGVKNAGAMVVHSLMLVLLIVSTSLYVHYIPKMAVSLVMLYLAWMMLDAWSKRHLAEWLRPGKALWQLRHPHSTPMIFLVVILTAMASNLVWGVSVGLLCAVFVFVQRQSLNVIRRGGTLADRRSAAMRNEAQQLCLQENAHRVLYLELQGALFFGTSEQLLRGVRARLSPQHRHLLLDMRRVLELDDAGCETIERLQAEMARRGGMLVLSSCSETLQWRSPQEVRELCSAVKQPVCRSLDEALEVAEDRIIAQLGSDEARAEICEIGPDGPAAQLLSGLSQDQRNVFLQALERCEFEAGSIIFRKDEPGDSLHLVVCGRVDIWLNHGDADAVRLASFRQGVTFGEMGLLRDKPRTADAVAVNDVLTLRLSRQGLEKLQRDNPAVLAGILTAISQELSSRLGKTNRALRAALQT